MNLVAIMPARNEGWVLGLSARAALRWCDSLIVMDHASTDDTPEIIRGLEAEFPCRIVSFREDDSEWREMDHRQRLLEFARGLGATHVAPVDADEVLAGDMLPGIRGHVEALKPGCFAGIKMRNLHRSIDCYRSDNSPFGSMAGTMLAFADAPQLSWAPRNGYQHHQRSPANSRMGTMINTGGGLLHLQFASWRRLLAKHALYKASERIRYSQKPIAEIEKMYNLAPDETGLKTTQCPAEWLEPYADIMHHLDLNREPWQEAATRRLVAEHGAARFAGLNLFGVV